MCIFANKISLNSCFIMKKNKLIIFLILSVILGLSSCKKKDTTNSFLLHKRIFENGDYYLYRHNIDNKIILENLVDSSGMLNNNYSAGIYDNSTLHDRINNYYVYRNGSLLSEYSFRYNTSTIESSVFPTNFNINNQNGRLYYSGDKVIGMSLFPYKYDYEYNGSNVKKVVKTGSVQGQYLLIYTKEYEYDDKNNPYYNFESWRFLGNVVAMNNNCVTKITKRDGNGNVITSASYNYSYEYSDSDFPIKETVTNFDNTFIRVTIFEYTNIDY